MFDVELILSPPTLAVNELSSETFELHVTNDR